MEINEFLAALQTAEKQGLIGSKGVYETEGMQIYSHGFFSPCGSNDIISAYVDGKPFSSWLTWIPENFERKHVKLITSRGPSGEQFHPTSGVMTGKCAGCETVQQETCEIDHDKALLCRRGREISLLDINYSFCEKQPVFSVDGQPIGSDAEWQAALAADVLGMDVEEILVQGNRHNLNESDGLENLVVTGYADCRRGTSCEALDSIVINWAEDDLNGVANGHGSIITKITDIVRRFKLRAGQGNLNVARDVILMMPTHLRDALVDYWASLGTFLVVGTIQLDAQVVFDRRQSFIKGGLYGDGWLPVDGVPVSIVANDFITFSGHEGDCSDIYVLTRRAGVHLAMYGAYQDFGSAAAVAASRFGADKYSVSDGGKFFIVHEVTQGPCFNTSIYTRPGLIVQMPYLQARIYDVCVTSQFAPISKQPGSPYFQYSPATVAVTSDLPCY